MKNMQRVIIFLLVIFLGVNLGINTSYAYTLVLPKEKKSVVNKEHAFFVGKAQNTEIITINDKKIYVAPNGAFAHTVKLKEGKNRIVVRSNFSTQIYNFYKSAVSVESKPALKEFEPKRMVVIKDRTPMRDNPQNSGMNRLSHLFESTNILVNGEQGDFYRIYLSKNKTAWISKEDLKEPDKNEAYTVPTFITMNSETFKNASVHTIEFTGKLPYTIDETDKEIIFKIYNPEYSDNSVYTVNIKKPSKYTYKTILSNGTYVFKVNELPVPEEKTLDGMTIVIDPGHGGSEPGAIGCLGDKEKDINLRIGLELQDRLRLMGANVIMTRECDGYVSLDDRIKIAEQNCPQIFVSIHLNSIPDIDMNIRKNRGTSVYYYNDNSKELAKIVQKSLLKELSTRNDGVKQGSFKVLRRSEYLSILVEAAYMTNPMDSVLYREEGFAYNAARGIADGILNYLVCD